MRIGLLVHSLPAALSTNKELQNVPDCELFVLLCPTEESSTRGLAKHLARLFLKTGRRQSLKLLLAGKVILLNKPLEHPESVRRIKDLKLDIGLHKAGMIYREPTIGAFSLGILNPHIGLLPAYRGRNVMEWSILQGSPVGISVFFIDSGIDTGKRIVLSEEVDISHCRSIAEAKEYLFGLDAVFLRRALELLREENFQFKLNDGSGHRYYVMSRLFQGVVEKLITAKN